MAWTLLQVLVERLAQVLIFFLVARLIGAAAFGVAAIAVVPSAISVAILQGVIQVIVQKREVDSDYLATAFTLTTFLGILLAGATVLVSPVIAGAMRISELQPLIALTAIAPVACGLGAVSEGMLTRDLAFQLLAVRRTIAVIAAGVVCVGLAYAGHGALSVVIQSILAVCATSLVPLWLSAWKPRVAVSRRSARAFLSFSGAVLSTSALVQANVRLVDLVIGYQLGPAAAGTFRLARTVMDLIASVTFNPIASVLLPIFSRLGASEEALAVQFARLFSLCLLLFCGIAIGIALSAESFVQVALGASWSQMGPVLALLGLVFPTMAITSPLHAFMVAAERPRVNVVSNALQLLGNMILIPIGASFGILGASLAYVLRAYLTFLATALYLRRVYPEASEMIRKSIPIPLLACFLVVVIAPLAGRILHIGRSEVGEQAMLLVFGVLTYFVVLRLGAKPAIADAIDLVRLPPRIDRAVRQTFGLATLR